ncbi:MAG: hypothetical protein H6601_00020 [Flavobacteriales bacterium]|nr:hypothetical protein [Flavobacteriales bacterium]
MMVHLRFVFILFFSFFRFSEGNAQELKLEKTIAGEFDFLTTDHIGRMYVARGHELFLYSKEGDLMYQYSDLSRGQITHLDTRNPLKLLLFYPGYSQIAFLDNTLSLTRDIVQLSQLQLELAQLACTSFDNGFWVYDPVSFRLIRFDQGLNITNEVANINQLVGADLNPNQMLEEDSWLYMNDPDHGVFVFDSFGTFTKLIPIPGAERINVRSNGVFLEMKDRLIKYDPLSFNQTEIELPIKDFKMVRIEKQKLFLLTDAGVQIYTFSK